MLRIAASVAEERAVLLAARGALAARRTRLDAARRALSTKRSTLDAVVAAIFDGTPSGSAVVLEAPWRRVLRIFALLPIAAPRPVPRRGSLQGIMTICGLPLPNNLTAATTRPLSAHVYRAALAAIARLTASVALALDVVLPHPIRDRPASPPFLLAREETDSLFPRAQARTARTASRS